MKPTLLPALSLAAGVLALALSGCNTFDRRAEEKAAVFNNLDPGTQQRLKKGEIAIGDTADMVYIAMGNPDERSSTLRENGEHLTWVYNVYYQEYLGSVTAGYRRIVVFDRSTNRYIVYYQPVNRDVFRQHVDERLRIEFRNGRVVTVEETKP